MRLFQVILFACIAQLCISQDAYHADLLEWLNENYGIENPEFSLANNSIVI